MSRMIDDEETLKDNGLIEIDGCNVAECKYFNNVINEEPYCNIDEEHLYTCNSDNNCYFKQLQRAKAENEKLKSRNKLYKKIIKENIEKANNNFMILTACLQGNLSIDEVKEYVKLNAKNDELKRKLKSYKQALEDIRGIAKKGINSTDPYERMYGAVPFCKPILDRIDEVLK